MAVKSSPDLLVRANRASMNSPVMVNEAQNVR